MNQSEVIMPNKKQNRPSDKEKRQQPIVGFP